MLVLVVVVVVVVVGIPAPAAAFLVMLPVVESAFDPFAYSHGRAAGQGAGAPHSVVSAVCSFFIG